MVSIIFVEPESPGNIGSIARCMKNFGARPLILVNPCSLQGAEKMAMHAEDILTNVVTVPTFVDALALVDITVATTSVTSGIVRNAVTPEALQHMTGNVGIVIGRESNGLTTEEIEQCDLVVSIPASEEYPVLNAASACCILLYHVFVGGKENKNEREREKKKGKEGNKNKEKPKSRTQKKILDEFDAIADLIEKRPHRKRIWKIVLKRVLSKAFPTSRETTVLLGFSRRIRTVLESKPSQKH
jgi:TrmH family RNA methyltransferase